MSPTAKAWVQIHLCVVLWGFTAILGKLITLPALPLVWWRMVMVTSALAVAPSVWRGVRGLPIRVLAAIAGVGVLVAAHWVTFYESIKLSNASVAATCMAFCPVFLSIVEPVIVYGLGARSTRTGERVELKHHFEVRELLLGVAAVPGVALVVGGLSPAMRVGLLIGAVSAFISAIYVALNKRLIERADALTMTAVEMAAGLAALSVAAPALGASVPFAAPDARNTVLLIVLALVCTLVPFALSLVAMRHISAFGSMLAVNLEPIYAIVLAMAFFGEQREVTLGFYAGVALLLVVVFSYPLVAKPETAEAA